MGTHTCRQRFCAVCQISTRPGQWAYIWTPRTVSSCFNILKQICSIRLSVTRLVLQSLIMSLVLSRRSVRPSCLPRTEQTSRSKILARGSSRQTGTITFHRYYAIFTGCGRRGKSTTRLFSCIGVCTDLLRRTRLLIYRASRTCRPLAVYRTLYQKLWQVFTSWWIYGEHALSDLNADVHVVS